ncbi:hypothetical protein FQR65_LT12416 [Abscondita terminalis]|nr:hypothetical protein FQR65_LT12416 [Abscondita terminalis]
MFVYYLFTTLATFGALFYAYFAWTFSHWKRKNVPQVQPRFPLGTSENPFARTEFIGHRIKRNYDEFKAKGHKHAGLYFMISPSYLPIEPEYIKNIMCKDFRFFTDRGTYSNVKSDPLSGHLFNLEGEKWKSLRYKLTPTFTSGKMKMMFPSLVQCGKQLMDAMRGRHGPIDARKSVGAVVALANRKLALLLNIVLTPRHISDFFINLVKDTVKYRRDKGVVRKDFMQILMDLQDENEFTVEEMAANTFVFFLAGFETSSTTMSFSLFELARNPKIQETVRDEIDSVLKKHGNFTYEALGEMKYLNQVVDETLRMYPPGAVVSRVCVEDYKMPDAGVTLERGARILIPIYAIHHDPDYYPNPDVFDPERFSEENVGKRHSCVYLPFGAGPRICIGLRFGLMQTKLGLAMLIRNFQFSLSTKMKLPIEIDPTIS